MPRSAVEYGIGDDRMKKGRAHRVRVTFCK
jgi:hypothetical protein